MTKQEAIDHFGGAKDGGVRKLADALGISVQAVYDWPDEAIPIGRQYQLQVLTKGRLKVSSPDSQPAA